MSELKRCTRCVMPETWPGITFDNYGICNICRNYEKKAGILWEHRMMILQKILAEYRNRAREKENKYDCIVGYSGGKDTAYTLWAMVKKYGMKPLAVTFDHGFKLPPWAEYNMTEIPKMLDVDHLRFYIGGKLRNEMCRKGSIVLGDFCIHCHLGVGAFPTRISASLDIPLQIWGEPTGEYQTQGDIYGFDDLEEQDYEHYKNIFQAGTTPDMVKPDGYEDRDMMPFKWPENYEPKAIYLGNFEPWDQYENVKIIKKELGWLPNQVAHKSLLEKYGTYNDFDKVDCPYEMVRNWQKYLRRGFDKLVFQCSKDIRDSRMDRDTALNIISQHEGKRPSNMEDFIKETGMSEGEFLRITSRKI